MNRKVKDLPKHFHKAKIEFDRLSNLFWSTRLNEKGTRIETVENTALLYLLTKEYMAFAETNFNNAGTKLLEIMGNKKEVYLPEFGKVIRFDEEAQWIFVEDMNSDEWREYDIKCSVDYANKK